MFNTLKRWLRQFRNYHYRLMLADWDKGIQRYTETGNTNGVETLTKWRDELLIDKREDK